MTTPSDPSAGDGGPADPARPVLQTPRLRLRPHRLDDHAARCAMTANPATMRFIGGKAQSPEENFARILRYAGHWALFGYGLFAVEERAGGRFVGEVGLMHFARGLGGDFDAAPEAAWVLDADVAGRGYAGEAVAAAIGWHERTVGAGRQVCIIAPENTPSLRVAAKLGFSPFRQAIYHDHPVILHERAGASPHDAARGLV
jgi:RimJ/RimL family protein N-acetyltransferase